MKKIGLLCITVLMGLSLAGCSNSNSNKNYTKSSSHISSKVVKKHSEKKSSSTSSSSQVQKPQQDTQQSQVQQQNQQSQRDTQQSQSQQQNQQSQHDTQQSQSGSNTEGKTIIAGHSFHREKLYDGTTILVGDNGEGEAGEWVVNDQTARNYPNVKAQLNAAYGN